MKRKVFTRRRQAVRAARRSTRLALWLGLPVVLLLSGWEVASGADLPLLALIAASAALVVWIASVFKAHDLTGEWRLY